MNPGNEPWGDALLEYCHASLFSWKREGLVITEKTGDSEMKNNINENCYHVRADVSFYT